MLSQVELGRPRGEVFPGYREAALPSSHQEGEGWGGQVRGWLLQGPAVDGSQGWQYQLLFGPQRQPSSSHVWPLCVELGYGRSKKGALGTPREAQGVEWRAWGAEQKWMQSTSSSVVPQSSLASSLAPTRLT